MNVVSANAVFFVVCLWLITASSAGPDGTLFIACSPITAGAAHTGVCPLPPLILQGFGKGRVAFTFPCVFVERGWVPATVGALKCAMPPYGPGLIEQASRPQFSIAACSRGRSCVSHTAVLSSSAPQHVQQLEELGFW